MAHTKKHRFNKHQSSATPKKTMADKADINVLYEQSVQCVESEINIVPENIEQFFVTHLHGIIDNLNGFCVAGFA